MDDKLMYIPDDVKQNYPFFSFIILVETFGHLINPKFIKVLKVFNPTNKIVITVYKTLGTRVTF